MGWKRNLKEIDDIHKEIGELIAEYKKLFNAKPYFAAPAIDIRAQIVEKNKELIWTMQEASKDRVFTQ